MSNNKKFPLTDLHRLATKMQADVGFKNKLKANPNYQSHVFNYIFHATNVSPFCPRAMLECEKIINKMVSLGEYEQYKVQF